MGVFLSRGEGSSPEEGVSSKSVDCVLVYYCFGGLWCETNNISLAQSEAGSFAAGGILYIFQRVLGLCKQ